MILHGRWERRAVAGVARTHLNPIWWQISALTLVFRKNLFVHLLFKFNPKLTDELMDKK
jgi:hypothetical protein